MNKQVKTVANSLKQAFENFVFAVLKLTLGTGYYGWYLNSVQKITEGTVQCIGPLTEEQAGVYKVVSFHLRKPTKVTSEVLQRLKDLANEDLEKYAVHNKQEQELES